MAVLAAVSHHTHHALPCPPLISDSLWSPHLAMHIYAPLIPPSPSRPTLAPAALRSTGALPRDGEDPEPDPDTGPNPNREF